MGIYEYYLKNNYASIDGIVEDVNRKFECDIAVVSPSYKDRLEGTPIILIQAYSDNYVE